jgi:RNA recognition motif-containing protein
MSNRLYIRNLPSGISEESVRIAFARAGQVRDVRILKNRATGRSRGFAFVTMSSAEEAGTALSAMNGLPLEGCAMRVSLVTDPAATSSPGLAERDARKQK